MTTSLPFNELAFDYPVVNTIPLTPFSYNIVSTALCPGDTLTLLISATPNESINILINAVLTTIITDGAGLYTFNYVLTIPLFNYDDGVDITLSNAQQTLPTFTIILCSAPLNCEISGWDLENSGSNSSINYEIHSKFIQKVGYPFETNLSTGTTQNNGSGIIYDKVLHQGIRGKMYSRVVSGTRYTKLVVSKIAVNLTTCDLTATYNSVYSDSVEYIVPNQVDVLFNSITVSGVDYLVYKYLGFVRALYLDSSGNIQNAGFTTSYTGDLRIAAITSNTIYCRNDVVELDLLIGVAPPQFTIGTLLGKSVKIAKTTFGRNTGALYPFVFGQTSAQINDVQFVNNDSAQQGSTVFSGFIRPSDNSSLLEELEPLLSDSGLGYSAIVSKSILDETFTTSNARRIRGYFSVGGASLVAQTFSNYGIITKSRIYPTSFSPPITLGSLAMFNGQVVINIGLVSVPTAATTSPNETPFNTGVSFTTWYKSSKHAVGNQFYYEGDETYAGFGVYFNRFTVNSFAII
jgi:hypothetical protein